MKITERPFGRYSTGREGRLFTIENDSGMSASFTDYGASIVSITVPDSQGVPGDVVLGYDSAAEYEGQDGALGAVCGRFANRLRGSRITLNGREYALDANNPHYTLHGGSMGFHRRVWDCGVEGDKVVFTLLSEDGDMGFPGTVKARAAYSITEGNALILQLCAVSDADTVVNLTNHAYFNLSGHGSGDEHQLLKVNAAFYNPQDSRQLPTGEVLSVAGTPFDFTRVRDVYTANASGHPQIEYAGGLDHNFLLNKSQRGALELAGALCSASSGRIMGVYTTQPAMMVYTANSLSPRQGKGGAEYRRRGAVCMEAQAVPDSMAHSHFPSPILRAGQEYREAIVYAFSTREEI